MYEFVGLRQHPEGFRRLFSDDYFDLYLWYDAPGGQLLGFQLIYDKLKDERALTWRARGGYSHDGVDSGDANIHQNKTPVLVADGAFAKDTVVERFRLASEGMEEPLRGLILQRLEAYENDRATVLS